MLIIFDLDDTLIPTTAQITPFKLSVLLNEMKRAHPQYSDLDDFMLHRINLGALGSLEALKEFFELQMLDSTLIKKYLQEFTNRHILPDEFNMIDGAESAIDDLIEEHKLTIVTRGKLEFQQKKLNHTTFPLQKFQDWICVEGDSKLQAYQLLKEKFHKEPFEVVVIGDRIDKDLVPAKQLGFYTVHLNSGRERVGLLEKNGIIDYQICSLTQLSGMIRDIQLKNFLRNI